MIVGGVVIETGLEKVVKGVREQGRVAKRREMGQGAMEGVAAGIGRGWRGSLA